MSTRSSSPKSLPWLYFLAGCIFAVLIFLLGAASYWALFSRQAPPVLPDTVVATAPQQDTSLYEEAWQILQQDYYGELPPETERIHGAIRGSVETLQDPYTYFVEPEPAVREEEQLQGHFGGVGAYLELQEDGRIRLIPMVERPAARAGIEKGDILIAVDGVELPVPADLDDVTNRVRGPVGTVVRLTVQRGAQVLDFDIERQQIELPSVSWQILDDKAGIGYIRIERFSALTSAELRQAIQEALAAGLKTGLVLDLRGNPGGLLDAAIDVSSQFLDGGVILIERHADGSEKTYEAKKNAMMIPSEMPLVILVDGGTASAAEIVAGALKDRGRATLVGAQTYGKGSIQRIHRLSDQSALHVTFAKWFTPSGYKIDGQGLRPDVPVSAEANDETESDPFIQTALDLFKRNSS